MKHFLHRVVALLLMPALLVDPALAHALTVQTYSETFRAFTIEVAPFQTQAISPMTWTSRPVRAYSDAARLWHQAESASELLFETNEAGARKLSRIDKVRLYLSEDPSRVSDFSGGIQKAIVTVIVASPVGKEQTIRDIAMAASLEREQVISGLTKILESIENRQKEIRHQTNAQFIQLSFPTWDQRERPWTKSSLYYFSANQFIRMKPEIRESILQSLVSWQTGRDVLPPAFPGRTQSLIGALERAQDKKNVSPEDLRLLRQTRLAITSQGEVQAAYLSATVSISMDAHLADLDIRRNAATGMPDYRGLRMGFIATALEEIYLQNRAPLIHMRRVDGRTENDQWWMPDRQQRFIEEWKTRLVKDTARVTHQGLAKLEEMSIMAIAEAIQFAQRIEEDDTARLKTLTETRRDEIEEWRLQVEKKAALALQNFARRMLREWSMGAESQLDLERAQRIDEYFRLETQETLAERVTAEAQQEDTEYGRQIRSRPYRAYWGETIRGLTKVIKEEKIRIREKERQQAESDRKVRNAEQDRIRLARGVERDTKKLERQLALEQQQQERVQAQASAATERLLVNQERKRKSDAVRIEKPTRPQPAPRAPRAAPAAPRRRPAPSPLLSDALPPVPELDLSLSDVALAQMPATGALKDASAEVRSLLETALTALEQEVPENLVQATVPLREYRDQLTFHDLFRIIRALTGGRMLDVTTQDGLGIALQRPWDGIDDLLRHRLSHALSLAASNGHLDATRAAAMRYPLDKEALPVESQSLAPERLQSAIYQLQTTPTQIVFIEDLMQHFHRAKDSFINLAERMSPKMGSVYLAERFHLFFRYALNIASTSERARLIFNKMGRMPEPKDEELKETYRKAVEEATKEVDEYLTARLVLPQINGGLKSYFKEQQIELTLDLKKNPVKAERELVIDLVQRLAENAFTLPEQLEPQDYGLINIQLPDRSAKLDYFYKLMDDLNKAESSGYSTPYFILSRYGLVKKLKPLTELETIEEFKEALDLNAFPDSMPWEKLNQKLQHAFIEELSKEAGKPPLWLTVSDYEFVSLSRLSTPGEPFTLRNFYIYYDKLNTDKKHKITPYFILEKLGIEKPRATFHHAVETVRNSEVLKDALDKNWIPMIPWEFLRFRLINQFMHEVAGAADSPRTLETLTARDFENIPIPSLSTKDKKTGEVRGPKLRGLFAHFASKAPPEVEKLVYLRDQVKQGLEEEREDDLRSRASPERRKKQGGISLLSIYPVAAILTFLLWHYSSCIVSLLHHPLFTAHLWHFISVHGPVLLGGLIAAMAFQPGTKLTIDSAGEKFAPILKVSKLRDDLETVTKRWRRENLKTYFDISEGDAARVRDRNQALRSDFYELMRQKIDAALQDKSPKEMAALASQNFYSDLNQLFLRDPFALQVFNLKFGKNRIRDLMKRSYTIKPETRERLTKIWEQIEKNGGEKVFRRLSTAKSKKKAKARQVLSAAKRAA